MGVWPHTASALSSSEGALVSISISVDPRHLEDLLEALAQIEFPINPQIYHDAVVVRGDTTSPTTLVEFPAYGGRLEEVRRVLQSNGFDPEAAQITSMLDEIHGAGERHYRKHRIAAAS